MKPDVKLKVWVRSGGRCAFCKRYLLEGDLSARELTFGEVAHIVGHTKSKRSARGLAPLPELDRDEPDNLMLLCDDEHDQIDRLIAEEDFPVELLTRLKHEHEDFVRNATGLDSGNSSLVFRLSGDIEGLPNIKNRNDVARPIIEATGRFPTFDLSGGRNRIECDLTGVALEPDADTAFYRVAAAKISDEVAKLHRVIAAGDADHVSVFAIARLPLLVHLGAELDDQMPTDVYQLHRPDLSWAWPDSEAEVSFIVTEPTGAVAGPDAVLVADVSATTRTDLLPADLSHLPRFRLEPVGMDPHLNLISSPTILEAFFQAAYELFQTIETHHPGVTRLHVFGALPVSAAVDLGRAHNSAVHPTLVTYHRTDSGYVEALEVGA